MNRNTIALTTRPHLLATIGLALLMFCGVASAQIDVRMQLDKKTYVAHEPITAQISVRNLAGHDLVLSQPGGGGWLNVDVLRDKDSLNQRPTAPRLKPLALKAGATYTTSINLGRYYPLGLPGDYGVTASVYYPPLKRYFKSGRNLVRVRKAKTLWSRSFGVPQGENRPVQFRKYSLLSFRDRDSAEIYIRVSAQDDSAVYATRSLGGALRSYDPNVEIDAANKLHVLHRGLPQLFAHSVVDSNGNIKQEYYKPSTGSKPVLRNMGGNIVVRGGVKTDRHGVADTERAAAARRQDPGTGQEPVNRTHSANERPAGLPLPNR